MLTVYFDTAFYVALARTEDGAATTAIDALNSMSVRGVLSLHLLRELLASADRPEADARLHERVSAISRASYCTATGLGWDALLHHGPSRRTAADLFAAVDDGIVQAESAAHLARSASKSALKKEAEAHTLAQHPYLTAGGIDFGLLGDTLRPLLSRLGVPVPDPLAEAALPQLQEDLARLQEGYDVDGLARLTNLMASVLATDNRPYEVVLGRAGAKKADKLAHTLRDAGHMGEFCAHASEIDLFQMDGPQHRAMLNNPSHELRRLGLDPKCFAAAGLSDALAEVRARIDVSG